MRRVNESKRTDDATWIVFVIVLLDALALALIVPILPLYAARLGGDPLTIAFVAGAYPLAQLIGAPLMGALSDRFGRKPVLLLSLMGSFAGYVLMALAPSPAVLIAARAVDGLSGGNLAVAYAILADLHPPEQRARVFGMTIGTAFGIGFIFGPLVTIGIVVFSDSNFALVAVTAAAYSLMALLAARRWLVETHPPVRTQRPAQSHPPSRPTPAARRDVRRDVRIGFAGLALLLTLGLQQFAFGGFERMLSLFNLTQLGMGAQASGYVFIYVGVLVVYAQARLIRRWVARWGEVRVALGCIAALALGLLMLSATPAQPAPGYDRAQLTQALTGDDAVAAVTSSVSPAQTLRVQLPDAPGGWAGLLVLLIALIPISLGGALLRPLLTSMISVEASASNMGSATGIAAAVVSAANAIAPVAGGLVFVNGPTAPFGLYALFALAAVVPFLSLVLFARWARLAANE